MEFVCGNSLDEIGQFLGKWYIDNAVEASLNPPYSAIGFVKSNELKGVATFTEYTGSCIDLHIYMPGCLTRQSIKFILNYVFNDLNCCIYTAKPMRSNKKLLRILNKLDKDAYLTVIPRYYGRTKDKDAVLHVFTREWASKWIKLNAECSESTKAA